MKELVADLNKSKYELKRNPWSAMDFVGVIEVKGKFEAMLQVPGDCRGGERSSTRCQASSTRRRMRRCTSLTWRRA